MTNELDGCSTEQLVMAAKEILFKVLEQKRHDDAGAIAEAMRVKLAVADLARAVAEFEPSRSAHPLSASERELRQKLIAVLARGLGVSRQEAIGIARQQIARGRSSYAAQQGL